MTEAISRLLDLVAPWCEPTQWDCVWRNYADWKKHRADAAELARDHRDEVRRGRPGGEFDRYARESLEFADVARQCWLDPLGQWRAINDLLVEAAPELLGELPLFRLECPGDGLDLAARTRRLYGLLLAAGRGAEGGEAGDMRRPCEQGSADDRLTPKTRAVALVWQWEREGRSYTHADVARAVGLSVPTLKRDAAGYMTARRAARASRQPPRGTIGAGGRVEAWTDDE